MLYLTYSSLRIFLNFDINALYKSQKQRCLYSHSDRYDIFCYFTSVVWKVLGAAIFDLFNVSNDFYWLFCIHPVFWTTLYLYSIYKHSL